MSDPDRSYVIKVKLKGKEVELAYGTRALRFMERERDTPFLKLMNVFESLEKDPTAMRLGDIIFFVRAGFAYLPKDEMPSEDNVCDLIDLATGEGDTDDLTSLLLKVVTAIKNGIPARKPKQGATTTPTGEASPSDPQTPSSTGTPS